MSKSAAIPWYRTAARFIAAAVLFSITAFAARAILAALVSEPSKWQGLPQWWLMIDGWGTHELREGGLAPYLITGVLFALPVGLAVAGVMAMAAVHIPRATQAPSRLLPRLTVFRLLMQAAVGVAAHLGEGWLWYAKTNSFGAWWVSSGLWAPVGSPFTVLGTGLATAVLAVWYLYRDRPPLPLPAGLQRCRICGFDFPEAAGRCPECGKAV